MRKVNILKIVGLTAGLLLVQPLSTYAGQWVQETNENADRWWYDNGDGTYLSNGWYWIDGDNDGVHQCYKFDADGWMYANQKTEENIFVNELGQKMAGGFAFARTGLGVGTVVADADSMYNSGSTGSSSSSNTTSVSDLAKDDDARWNREMAEEFVELLNKERVKNGLEEVYLTEDATYYAEIRAMQVVDDFNHSVAENDYIEQTYYTDENCNKNVTSAQDSLDTFKKSWGHWVSLTKIDHPIYECGVGFYRMDNGRYAVSVNFNLVDEDGYRYADYIK